MPNGFRKVEVKKPWFSAHGDFETASKFNMPNRDRKYIKILALCLTYATARMMYPHTEHAEMAQVRDMCRHGLLERYKRAGSRAYWYKTTPKGYDLLVKALEVSR